jgi:aminoglycoside phosphotransferase (APT) family kinase protein
MRSHVANFIADCWQVPASQVRVKLRSIPGGLESRVAHAHVYAAGSGSKFPHHFIVKELRGRAGRETDIYDLLWKHLEHPPVARVFGSRAAAGRRYLFLEHVQSPTDWPWRDTVVSAAVCRALAELHDAAPKLVVGLWDYEASLAQSADETLALAASARNADGQRVWPRYGALRRIVQALPSIRRRLLEAETTLIHGDVHPGNIVTQRDELGLRVTLLDWARARVGSPLEDVASWLHSLGCWEPESRRRHDTLLRSYLGARRSPERLLHDLRIRYWLASVSNGLAGAIRYHIATITDPSAHEQTRADSHRALREWQRVTRRAAGLIART